MIVLTDNNTLTSTITANSENPNYPFQTNLVDTRLIKAGKSLIVSGFTLTFDMGAAVGAEYFAILNHNFTSGATVHIQANSADSWGAPPVDRTQTILDVILDPFGTTYTYRYWRVTVTDAANPDAELSIGQVYIGSYSQFPHHSLGYTFGYKTNSLIQSNYMGVSFGVKYPKVKTINVDVLNISNTEKSTIETFFDTVDLTDPFIMIFWDNDYATELPVYCRMVGPPEFVRVNTAALVWNSKFNLLECK